MPSDSQCVMLLMLDILGFQNYLTEHGLSNTHALYERIVAFLETIGGDKLAIVPIPNSDGTANVGVGWLNIEHCTFSDTFVIWTEYDPLRTELFCGTCSAIVCHCLDAGITVRGAITVGEAVLDRARSIFLGEPIIEAARVEKACEWIGVSFGPSYTREPYNRYLPAKAVLPYRRHCKPGCGELISGLVLDWPRTWRGERKTDLHLVVNRLDRNVDYHRYYCATHDFVEFSQRHHDWFLRNPHLSIDDT